MTGINPLTCRLGLMLCLTLTGLALHNASMAQADLSKEVSVVRPYSPTIADAAKTRFIPRLDDTVQFSSRFDYNLLPVRFSPDTRLQELAAETYRPAPREELRYSYASFGMGNYWSPMARLAINTLRNEKMSLGIDLSHLSSQGRIKMDDQQKVYAGYGDNRVKIYGERFFKGSTLKIGTYFLEDHHFLYGYSTDSIAGVPLFPVESRVTAKQETGLQRFINAGAQFSLSADKTGSRGWDYRFDGGYNFLIDGLRAMEHEGQLRGGFSKAFNMITIGAEGGGSYIYRTLQPDSLSYGIANLDPWIRFDWKMVSLKAGPKVAMDRNASDFLFYPNVRLEINITNVLVPYLGLNGYYENHTLRSASRINPYLIDNLDITPTNHRFIAYGGLRGRFHPKVAFNAEVSWEDARNLHFYLPDTTVDARNRFTVNYDHGEIFRVSGEVSLRQSENLTFILKGNYYQYRLDTLPAPWHRPDWDFNFTARYAWKKRLVVKSELFLIGPYSVPESDPMLGAVKKEKALIDINIGAEYRIKPWLSTFARVNNLISDRYFIWQNYPMQGINFTGGLTFLF